MRMCGTSRDIEYDSTRAGFPLWFAKTSAETQAGRFLVEYA
jgi:hypothetical protein